MKLVLSGWYFTQEFQNYTNKFLSENVKSFEAFSRIYHW